MFRFILFLYLIIFVLLYPFWNILLIFIYINWGIAFSAGLLKIKYAFALLTLIVITMNMIYSIFKLKQISLGNYIFILLWFYSLSILFINYLFYPYLLSFKDILVIFYTNLLAIFIFLLPFIKSAIFDFKEKVNIFRLFFKIFLLIGFFIIIFGFFEKIFISDEFLKSLHYNQLLGQAKGLEFKTYSHSVPDNLFTMMEGFKIRRMISLIGEPLYFAYYIFPITFIFFTFFYLKRNFSSFFLFFFSLMALVLSISRNMLIAFFVSFLLFLIFQEKKYKNTFILLFSIIFLILIFSIPFLGNYFFERDISFQGHIKSFIYFAKYIGISGLIFPTFDTIINNIILLKKEASNFIAESAFLIILSNFGLLFTFTALIYSITNIFVSINKVNKKVNLDIKKDYILLSFIISFPYILFGYFITIFFSPHIFTFQIGNYILGLGILYLIFKNFYIKR